MAPVKDPVTDEVRFTVLLRDGGCVAPLLDPLQEGSCRDAWGNPLGRSPFLGSMELDHVRDEPMMGKRAPSDPLHLVTLCPGHHRLPGKGGAVWATAQRPLLRKYLGGIQERMERAHRG